MFNKLKRIILQPSSQNTILIYNKILQQSFQGKFIKLKTNKEKYS